MTSPDMDRNADEDASSRAAPLRAQFACVVVWSTGVDTRVDKIVRLAAVRPSKGGDWDSFERLCSGANEDPALGPRLAEDFGLDVRTLDSAPGVDEAWRELREFVGERPVVTHDGPLLEAWAGALDDVVRDGRAPIAVVGLDDVASLVEPGHLTSLGSTQLIEALVESSLVPQPPAAIQPPHVLTALAELVARFRDLGPLAHALCARSWGYALDGLRGEDATAARRLRQVLDIVDRPSTWGGDAPHFADWRLVDGVLEEADVDALDEDDPLALLDPAVARVADDAEATGKLSANTEDAAPFVDDDLALLDDVFRIHLPALFAPDGARREDLYRKSQHRVAEEVARCLGSDRLLLVHAPTGTGKTLAYLLPALLWAHRYRVRVGVATYTRALQTQAMEREVPRALAALADAGVAPGFRVSVLKGREHSLCWRALRIHVPQAGDDPEVWLSWTALVLFGLRDGEGDLDRFPRRSVVRMLGAEGYRESLSTLFGQVRARSGCCSAAEDRRVCAAEAARTRAEGSHVVLTNQSFALARPEFFRRVIFDECEHLHDQALSAWSHRVSFPDMRRALERLRTPGARGASSSRRSGPLDRLARRVEIGSGARERLDVARGHWSRAASALSALEKQVAAYEAWRREAMIGRGDAEQFGLFREYVDAEPGAVPMIEARLALEQSLARLDAALAQLAEELETAPLRRGARVRRALELARIELSEIGQAVAAWLPMRDGAPHLDDPVFHDVERSQRGDGVLAALLLLPGEALGRHYYPELASAAFVSATTRLGGGFDKAKGYLGLDRVAGVDEVTGEIDRTLGTDRVTSFHAPEVFDYSRVLVGVPRGLPSVQNRDAYIDFLVRYLPWYAERTRGRMLVLFTSLKDVREVGERAGPAFREAGLPLYWQGMGSAGKEELSALFRERVESTLLGVDTFWYGADFPGETLETVAIARLPYGVPDRYHHAQCAAIGRTAQHQRIYMPRALAKFRQGFGRLMRSATDKGVVLVFDTRITERRHRDFLRELPVERPGAFDGDARARLVRGDLDLVAREAFTHLGRLEEIESRGQGLSFTGSTIEASHPLAAAGRDGPVVDPLAAEGPIEIDPRDLPF